MREEEIKTCKNCEQNFTIESDDFSFYEKIKVPPPIWCPECRQQRRYAYRNERTLYRRKCDLCGKSTVTIYNPNRKLKVYCPPCWWGDGWDPKDYARDFDFSRPFFEQFRELQEEAPRLALLTKNSVNSEYTNHSGENKNCYLCFGVFNGENNYYCTNMYGTPTADCMDNYRITGGGELLYQCIDCVNCYACQYSLLLRSCNNCMYCFDLRGCSNCLFSYNLRNKEYCIFNQQYSREEYLKKLEEFNLGSFKEREEMYKKWLKIMRENATHKFSIIENSVNVSGNQILDSKNAQHMFDVNEMEDGKYINLSLGMKNTMDCYHAGINCEFDYECHGVVRVSNTLFSHLSYDDSFIQYCDTCHNSQNLFGCISVKKGNYMILNKQYSKEDYEKLREKIIEHMKSTGEYGEFLPLEIAPVSYNETQAMIYTPMKKEDVLAKGWQWEDNLGGTYGKGTIEMDKITDDINEVKENIVKEALTCIDCTKNFNIVEPELTLLKRYKAPLHRRCPDCRYKMRITLRAPRKLWHRQCMCEVEGHDNHPSNSSGQVKRCEVEFETPYAPDRLEKVYCERCYQQEVY